MSSKAHTATHLYHDHDRTITGILYYVVDLWGVHPDHVDVGSFINWPAIKPWRVKRKSWEEATDLQRAYYLLHKARAVLAEDGGSYFLAPWPTTNKSSSDSTRE